MVRIVLAGVVVLAAAFQQDSPPVAPNTAGQGQNGGHGLFSQAVPVPKAEMDEILARTAAKYPKFHALYTDAMMKDKLITSSRWMRAPSPNTGPGAAMPNGVIILDPQFLEPGRPGFDDNRLVVVIEHEIGHLHYFQTTPQAERTSDRSEQAAFEYSLKTTRALAEQGDCGPLKTGVTFMKLRSEGTNLQDPHVRALKRMVTEPLYAGYVKYVAEAKACQSVTVQVPARSYTGQVN